MLSRRRSRPRESGGGWGRMSGRRPNAMKPVSPQRQILLAVLVTMPASAHAYVDPGSGLLVWQGLIAAVGIGVAFVRHPIDTIKRFLDRFRRK